METYFAADGNYGEWKDFSCVILPTADFSESDWEKIDLALDHERVSVALDIRARLDSEK